MQSLTYGFNDASEITAVTNAVDATLSQRYAYDGIGRLTGELNQGRGWEYDATGNRDRDSVGAQATTYTFDPASNRVLESSGPAGTRQYGYDALGNRVSESGAGRTASYGYDAFGRLEQAEVNGQAVAYTVNALGQRVRKEAASNTRYVYNGQNQLLAERMGGGWKRYLWLGGELVGVMTPANGLYYVHADHLGRPEVVTDGTKQVAWRARNEDPYGQRQVAVDQIGGLNLGFAGQYHDVETGLWYNGFRDYDASVGRYLQSDPIGLIGGPNTYQYAEANPVIFIDESGLSSIFLARPPVLVRPVPRHLEPRLGESAAQYQQRISNHRMREMQSWRNESPYVPRPKSPVDPSTRLPNLLPRLLKAAREFADDLGVFGGATACPVEQQDDQGDFEACLAAGICV